MTAIRVSTYAGPENRAFTPNDIPLGIEMMRRVAEKCPWELVRADDSIREEGLIGLIEATTAARTRKCLKATIVPDSKCCERSKQRKSSHRGTRRKQNQHRITHMKSILLFALALAPALTLRSAT